MWFYPVPALVALVGWAFLMSVSQPNVWKLSLLVTGAGVGAFLIWDGNRRKDLQAN
jgi:hypothetical protein